MHLNKDVVNTVLNVLNGSVTLAELKGLKEQHLAAIYEIGRSLYETQQYRKAEDIFKLLCLYDPWKKLHWFGLGASRQMQGLYEEAILAYHLALAMDDEDPYIRIHLAECYFRTGDKELAKKYAETALKLNNNRFSDITKKGVTLLNRLKKEGRI